MGYEVPADDVGGATLDIESGSVRDHGQTLGVGDGDDGFDGGQVGVEHQDGAIGVALEMADRQEQAISGGVGCDGLQGIGQDVGGREGEGTEGCFRIDGIIFRVRIRGTGEDGERGAVETVMKQLNIALERSGGAWVEGAEEPMVNPLDHIDAFGSVGAVVGDGDGLGDGVAIIDLVT